jgi:hypothetical protein
MWVCFVCGCGFDVDYNDEEEVEDEDKDNDMVIRDDGFVSNNNSGY